MAHKRNGIPPLGGRSVLIAVDNTDNSRYAFHWYLKWSKRADDGIIFIHVFETPALSALSFSSPSSLPTADWNKILAARVTAAKKLEDDYLAEGMAANLNCDFITVSGEKSGVAIVKQAEKMGAHLIIIGTRGLDKLKRTWMGSVSDYVVNQAIGPVMVIPNMDKLL